jgi:hypothetical protein
MNLHRRLTKLEERTPKGQPVVIWLNPGETQEEARNKAGVKDNEIITFVRWLT